MTCYNPIEAYLPLDFDCEGKRKLIFNEELIYKYKKFTIIKLEKSGILKPFDEHNFDIYDDNHQFPEVYHDKPINSECPSGYIIKVPCGKCLGCRLDYSRLWATRAVNEAFFYDYYKNCSFLSLTFNDNTLNNTYLGYSVDKAFFKSWVKRLRFEVKDKYGIEFRHMSCGEYGSKKLRPHYHMIIFGFNFPDKYVFKSQLVNGKQINYYRSPFLESLWHLPHSKESAGYSLIGDVNYETCAYVARYVTKKFHKSYYSSDKQQEFLSVSRMPGLGSKFCETYLNDIFNQGYVVLPNGFKSPVPRYYESICEKINPELYYNFKYEKFQRLYKDMLSKFVESSNNDSKRLSVLKECKELQYDKLERVYEL